MSYIDDMNHTQRIEKETVEHLREMRDWKISTGKIAAKVVEKVREEWAHQQAYFDNKITEHDIEIKKQSGILGKIWRGLNGIVK